VEHAIIRCAADLDTHGDICRPILEGIVGPAASAAFCALYANVKKLPSADTIRADPMTADLPPDLESGIAVVAILQDIARDKESPDARGAAWVYLGRIADTMRDVAVFGAKELEKFPPKATGKWGAAALKALTSLQTAGRRATMAAR
jgi:hypothetical protein